MPPRPSTNGQRTRGGGTVDFREIGSSGLRRTGGYVQDDSFVRNLDWQQQNKIFTEMGNTEPIVGSAFFAIDNLIRQVKWNAQPHDTSSQASEDADFLQSCMDDMSLSWTDFLSEVLTFLQFGWAYNEIVYKRRGGKVSDDPTSSGDNSKFDDGKIGWRKMALRSQDTLYKWEFDPNGGIQGMWQIAPPDYEQVLIPITKALLFRTTARRNDPQGRSILLTAYRPWFFKRRIEEIEGVGIERDLAGLPYVEVDPEILAPTATDGQKAMLASIEATVKAVRRDAQEGIIFPAAYDEGGNKLYTFSLLSSGGSRQIDVGGTIQRKSNEIAMSMMADFILLGHQNVGSFALSSDKTELFQVAITSFLDIIASVINSYAVPRLWYVNGMDLDKMPKIVHGDVSHRNLNELANFLTAMTNAGMITADDKMLDWVREVAELPERDPNEPKPPPMVPGGLQVRPDQAGAVPGNLPGNSGYPAGLPNGPQTARANGAPSQSQQ